LAAQQLILCKHLGTVMLQLVTQIIKMFDNSQDESFVTRSIKQQYYEQQTSACMNEFLMTDCNFEKKNGFAFGKSA
jgi:hypothetical protein